MRALIADDVELLRLNLRHHLERVIPGVDIQEADSLNGLLSHADGVRVDLILMDLKMPGMRGAASVADVRAAFPATVIVVVSGHADEDMIALAKASGANGYISKLTRGEALRTELRAYCAQ